MQLTDLLGPGWSDRAGLAAKFSAGQPFPHIVVENALNDAFCRRLLSDFPPFERGMSLDENGDAGFKSVVQDIRTLGGSFRQLDDLIADPDLLRLLGEVSGIPGLIYDPDYVGGGTHENRPGQDLDAHVDFNTHPRGWHRRLNLLLYLNPEWQESWGGALELRRSPREPSVSILPLFNRAVLFETSDHSWHAFPRIAPQAGTRRSIALYFYTPDPPPMRRTTHYVEAPLANDAPAAELQRLLTRRFAHVDRLLRRERGLLEQAGNLLSQYLAAGGSLAQSPARELGQVPLQLLDDLLERLYDREREARQLIDGATRLPRLHLEGPLGSHGQEGLWHDGWAGVRIRFDLEVRAPITELTINGEIHTLQRQTFTLRIGEQTRSITLGAGPFSWKVELALAPGDAALTIDAAHTFQPSAGGSSDDVRPLAWLVRTIAAR